MRNQSTPFRQFIRDTLRACWWFTGRTTWRATSRESGRPDLALGKWEHARCPLHKDTGMILIFWWSIWSAFLHIASTAQVPHSYAFKTKDDRRLDNPDQRIQEAVVKTWTVMNSFQASCSAIKIRAKGISCKCIEAVETHKDSKWFKDKHLQFQHI
jgi:hypothetical protein